MDQKNAPSLKGNKRFVGKVPFKEKLIYATGEINQGFTYTIISMFLLFFLTDVAGIPPITAAAIIMIGKIWDGVNNPLMGIITDRTRSRWGRRRPYILWAAVPTGICFILIWTTVDIGDAFLKALYYGGAYFLFATASTVFAVPYYSLGLEMTDDYDERTSIANVRAIVALVFSLIAATIPSLIINSGKNPQSGFLMMAIALGVFSALPLPLIFLKVKERFSSKSEPAYKLREVLKPLVTNRPFLWSNVIIFTYKIAVAISEGFLIYYLTYWLGRADELPIFMVIACAGWVLSTPVWTWITKKTDKRTAYIACSVVWIIGLGGFLFLPQTSSLLPAYIIQFVVGIGYGYAHVLPFSMLADVADLDELKTGKRREGLLYGVWYMFATIGGALALMPVSIILDKVGYVPNVEQQGAALQAMRLMLALGPAIPLVIGIIATVFYNLTKKKYKEIQAELEILRKNAVDNDRSSAAVELIETEITGGNFDV